MNQQQRAVVFTIVFFAVYLILKQNFSSIKVTLDGLTQFGLLSYILTYALIGIPIYLGTYLVNPEINIFKNLGLSLSLTKPILIASLFSLPMFLGGVAFFELSKNISFQNLIAGTIVIGFVEELFFRGFLFGLIYKYSKLGFLTTIIFGAIIFALGHLYQSQNPDELIGIFLVTFFGAILFAWLYVEWDYNLWVPIFLHALMNMAWYLFEMDETALGGILPNVFRGLTITLAIVFTIFYKRKHNRELAITRNTLIKKMV